MKGIELLKLTDEQKKLLETSELNYKRFAHVHFAIVSADKTEVIVKVWQNEIPTEKHLSAKELIERTRKVFEGIIPEGIDLHVRPIPLSKDELESYGITEIEKDMQELGLQSKDLVKLLDIDKSSLSRLLTRERELTKPHKAMFYYLFKYLKDCKTK